MKELGRDIAITLLLALAVFAPFVLYMMGWL